MIYYGDDGDTVILGKAGLWRCVIDPVLYYIYAVT